MTAEQVTPPSADNEWLPDRCPPWCEGGHAEALAEGNSWEDSQEHRGGGFGDVLQEIRNPIDRRVTRPADGGGWDLGLRQRPRDPNGLAKCDEPRVVLEANGAGFRERVELHLTSGEARVMAAQLIALADALDMPRYKRRRR